MIKALPSRRLGPVRLLVVAFLTAAPIALGCGPGPSDTAEDVPAAEAPDEEADAARALLEEARAAAVATRSASYGFRFGSRLESEALASGETRMLARTSMADSMIRVEGSIRPGGKSEPFVYSTDGQTVWSLATAARTAEIAGAGPHARGLAGQAIYGYLTEFVERKPYWKELGSSLSVRSRADDSVGGTACSVVEVSYPEHDGTAVRHVWYFGRDDALPRGLEWFDSTTGPGGSSLWIFDLRTEPLSAEDFRVEVPADFKVTRLEAPVGKRYATWQLSDAAGRAVSSSDFRGRVLVLDFWNTWCLICRSYQPSMRRTARDYAGEGVSFLGANVFETGDSKTYWESLGHPYPMLRDADELADLYGVPWQPAVVVLGPAGEELLNLLGGSGDREERIRAAIDEGLARTAKSDQLRGVQDSTAN